MHNRVITLRIMRNEAKGDKKTSQLESGSA